MGTSTDPPLITFDPAPDAAQRLRRLSQLLLGNATPSVLAESAATPIPPASGGEETNANEPYARRDTGST